MKKLLCLFLALIILCFTGCHEGGHGDGTETKDNVPKFVIASKEGGTSYTIIRSDFDTPEAKLAVTLRNEIRDRIGLTVPIKTDFSDKDVTEYEIVVGVTTREERVDPMSFSMGYLDWTIKLVGNRIYIRGGDYEGTKRAVTYFVEHYINEIDATVAIPEQVNLFVRGDYPITQLSINGNDVSKYQIVYPAAANPMVSFAAQELQRCLLYATGTNIPLVKDNNEVTEYELLVGQTNRGTVEADLSGLGDEGCVVMSAGNKIVMTGGENTQHGTLYAVYEFLRECIGYRFYASTTETALSAENIDVKNVNLRWTPTFDYRMILWEEVLFNHDLSAKQGISGDWGVGFESTRYPLHDWFIGNNAHTFSELAGVDPYAQPCLTNDNVYQKVLNNVMAQLASDTTGRMISVSQNDNYNYCKCSKCAAKVNELGNQSDLLIWFVNRIAKEVAKEYPDILVHTFAYQYTADPPKTVKPEENVLIQLCSVDCCMYCAFDDPDCKYNKVFYEQLTGWSKLTDKLWMWDYTAAFRTCCAPYTNFEFLRHNMKVLADNSVIGVFSQGQMQGGKQEFGVLRSYLVSRLLWDPMMTEEEYQAEIKGFMQAYYGAGWESVYNYLMKVEEINADKCIGIYMYGTGTVNTAEYKKLIDEFDAMWDAAEAAAAEDGTALLHIQLSRLQHTYIKQSLTWKDRYYNGDDASKAAYVAENQAFFDMLTAHNVLMLEGNPIGNYHVDVTQAPTAWTK